MAHVERRQQRRGDGSLGPVRWRVVYREKSGERGQQTFERRSDANRFMATVEADQARGEFIDPRLARITFTEWAESWWATTAANRPTTRARDASYLRTHIIPTFGGMQLGAIDHLTVRSWVAELSSRKAPATTQKAFQILGKILAAAVDAGLLKVSPCTRVPLPRVEREEMRFLRPDEVALLADAIHPRYRGLVWLGAYGGLRIGEMAGLRRSRLDLLRGRVDVAEVLVEVSGHITTGPPKTRSGRRAVSLPRFVTSELADHCAEFVGADPRSFVFTAPQGGPLRVPAWRRRVWAPAIGAAGLVPLRPHDLRHTAVALWIAASASPLEVSRRAGHTSTAFTLDRYGHLFPEADAALAERLDTFATSTTGSATVIPLR